MTLFKKIALSMSVLAAANAFALDVNKINFDAFVKGAVSKEAAFKLIFEIAQKYTNLVIYFGKKGCPFCAKTEQAIANLLSKYKFVTFVMVDGAKHPYFKNGTWPKVWFFKKGKREKETDSLSTEKLKELLDQYYR
jgi:thiol-disulfide isomerase/thioredoxin